MIIKNDETHLQMALVNAVDKEMITGTEACKLLCSAIRDDYFKKDGQVKKAKFDWFMGLLKKYPWQPVAPALFKFKIGDPVRVDEGIDVILAVIHERHKKGKTLTPAQVPSLKANKVIPENYYEVGLLDVGPMPMLAELTFLVPESKMIKVPESEVRNNLKT